jgi:hypothetical protein
MQGSDRIPMIDAQQFDSILDDLQPKSFGVVVVIFLRQEIRQSLLDIGTFLGSYNFGLQQRF